MLTCVCRNNKASLVNMLVTFCGKLECSYLTVTMLNLYLRFSTTPKDTKGNKKFMMFRFSSVLIRFLTFLFIFVSLGLQTAHLSYDKHDVTNFCHMILLLYFSVSEPIPNLRYRDLRTTGFYLRFSRF